LNDYDFPEANKPIVTACTLPAHYLITPAVGDDENAFLQQLSSAVSNGIEMVQLRQKNLAPDEFENLARHVIRVCHDAGARVLLNASVEIFNRLNADGIQLNAAALMQLQKRPLTQKYLVAASCHDANEIQKACDLGLDFALVSPVQPTATHPDARPLGWKRFAELTELSTIPVYALGGVSKTDTSIAWSNGGQGIAAIRALWEQPG
jgi:8-oxo-dGTP diphosphatase